MAPAAHPACPSARVTARPRRLAPQHHRHHCVPVHLACPATQALTSRQRSDVVLLITVAGATMLCLPGTFTHLVESLALLKFPLTLAGAVVLSREATSLAERLLRRSRTLLMASIAALWAVALSRLLLHADVRWAQSAWDWVGDTISRMS